MMGPLLVILIIFSLKYVVFINNLFYILITIDIATNYCEKFDEMKNIVTKH